MHYVPLIRLNASRRRFLTTLAALFASVTLTSSVVFAAVQSVTLAVTSDIREIEGKAVSDAILAHPEVSAVLLAGDTSNDNKTPVESYRKIYKGTYDRLLSKIYPCPGNHDTYSEPPLSGYIEFWGEAAHAPELYYSFNLGKWHIVSLNSEAVAKSDSEANVQLEWLKKDLAENPGAPVIAYWHRPFFSNAKHGGFPKMKPFWDALHAHGPAIVFSGHNHVYERFAPMNSDGEIEPETKGVQQFVTGPGGAKPVEGESEKAAGPASEQFHGGTQHVIFLTLFDDGGFSFITQSINSTGQSEIIDQGTGKLPGGPVPATN